MSGIQGGFQKTLDLGFDVGTDGILRNASRIIMPRPFCLGLDRASVPEHCSKQKDGGCSMLLLITGIASAGGVCYMSFAAHETSHELAS